MLTSTTTELPTRKCKQCRGKFRPVRALQSACTWECAQILAATLNAKKAADADCQKRKAERADRAKTKEKLDKLQPLGHWLDATQTVFNAYIRARDADLACVSCGRTGAKMNAGHYLSRGSHPELRFDEANTHKQCEYCNTHKHGNPGPYRVELMRRIGLPEIERLEGPNPAKKYTVASLEVMRAEYRAKALELEKARDV